VRCLTVLLLLSLPGLAHARPGPRPSSPDDALTLEAAGVHPRAFRRYGEPVLLDRSPARAAVTALKADLATLDRMLELVRDRRERKALKEQLASTQAKLEALEAALQNAPPVQRAERRHVEKHIVVTEAPPPSEPPLEPATGAQMARLEQSLRDASFRDDKLRVIRASATPRTSTPCSACSPTAATAPPSRSASASDPPAIRGRAKLSTEPYTSFTFWPPRPLTGPPAPRCTPPAPRPPPAAPSPRAARPRCARSPTPARSAPTRADR
jgi:hypothetical protein